MTTLIIGGTGFIGRRLIPLLAKQGEDSVVMDINPQTANFSELAKVRVLRGGLVTATIDERRRARAKSGFMLPRRHLATTLPLRLGTSAALTAGRGGREHSK